MIVSPTFQGVGFAGLLPVATSKLILQPCGDEEPLVQKVWHKVLHWYACLFDPKEINLLPHELQPRKVLLFPNIAWQLVVGGMEVESPR